MEGVRRRRLSAYILSHYNFYHLFTAYYNAHATPNCVVLTPGIDVPKP